MLQPVPVASPVRAKLVGSWLQSKVTSPGKPTPANVRGANEISTEQVEELPLASVAV